MGKCECRPGYTASTDDVTNATVCQPPTVILAKFLNNRTETSTTKTPDIKQAYNAMLNYNKKHESESTDFTEVSDLRNNLNKGESHQQILNYQNKNKRQAFK